MFLGKYTSVIYPVFKFSFQEILNNSCKFVGICKLHLSLLSSAIYCGVRPFCYQEYHSVV